MTKGELQRLGIASSDTVLLKREQVERLAGQVRRAVRSQKMDHDLWDFKTCCETEIINCYLAIILDDHRSFPENCDQITCWDWLAASVLLTMRDPQ